MIKKMQNKEKNYYNQQNTEYNCNRKAIVQNQTVYNSELKFEHQKMSACIFIGYIIIIVMLVVKGYSLQIFNILEVGNPV